MNIQIFNGQQAPLITSLVINHKTFVKKNHKNKSIELYYILNLMVKEEIRIVLDGISGISQFTLES
jgi:hypothetical protein